jgi:hypothetical protein
VFLPRAEWKKGCENRSARIHKDSFHERLPPDFRIFGRDNILVFHHLDHLVFDNLSFVKSDESTIYGSQRWQISILPC